LFYTAVCGPTFDLNLLIADSTKTSSVPTVASVR
jgi:hypothetical protein